MKNQGTKILGAITLLTGTLVTLPVTVSAARDSIVATSSKCLNLRTRASSRSAVKSCLQPGTRLQVLGNHGSYSYVSVNGKKGYVYNNYLARASRVTARKTDLRPALVKSNEPVAGTSFVEPTLVQNLPQFSSQSNDRIPNLVSTAGLSLPRDQVLQMHQDFNMPTIPGSGRSVVTTRQDESPNLAPTAGRDVTGNDLSALSWGVTKALTEGEIGRGNGYTLRSSVGWAKLGEDGSISINNKRSHCTSATHAHFLKMMGELHKSGHIQLNSRSREALNSNLFRDAWNSNGYGNGKLMEFLGGQNFTDRASAKKGDFMKMDRSNGSGHTTIFSHFEGNKVCYWSSNSSTRGVGTKCESLSGKTLTFSRITDLKALQAGLDNLNNELNGDRALADVRRRGGNGFVHKASLEIASASQLAAPPVLGDSPQVADVRGGRRQVAALESGNK